MQRVYELIKQLKLEGHTEEQILEMVRWCLLEQFEQDI